MSPKNAQSIANLIQLYPGLWRIDELDRFFGIEPKVVGLSPLRRVPHFDINGVRTILKRVLPCSLFHLHTYGKTWRRSDVHLSFPSLSHPQRPFLALCRPSGVVISAFRYATEFVLLFQREIANLKRLCQEKGAVEEEITACKPRRRSKNID